MTDRNDDAMQDDGPIEGDQSDFLFVILVWKKRGVRGDMVPDIHVVV
jgi:hypothetical protein